MEEAPDDRRPFTVADLRAFLAGHWRFERDLEDHRAGMTGVITGDATFAAENGALRYRETGEMRLGDYRGRAHQSYVYRFPDCGTAQVCFTDGRAFHTLDLRGGHWRAVHRCGADTYEGHFRVLGPDAWDAGWRITGPRKDQRLAARYQRVHAPPA